nr:hypothetical protein Iba_chr06eCG1730 [Ipomoea batatas]
MGVAVEFQQASLGYLSFLFFSAAAVSVSSLSVSGENATQQRHGKASSHFLVSPASPSSTTEREWTSTPRRQFMEPGDGRQQQRQPRASTATTAVSGSGGVGDGLLYGESPLFSLPAASSSDGCGKHGSHELRLPAVSVSSLSVSGENATQQRHGKASSHLLVSPASPSSTTEREWTSTPRRQFVEPGDGRQQQR